MTELVTKPKYKTVEELVKAFVGRNRKLIEEMLTYAWDLGREVQAIKNEAAYGDGALQTILTELNLSQSTVYAYAQFYATYPEPKDAIKLFADKEIPFRTVYSKLLTLPDDFRMVVEEKLKSGEISKDQLEKYVDDLKAQIAEAEENRQLEEDNTSVADQQAQAEAPEEDVKYAKKVKLAFYKVAKWCEKLEEAFHNCESELQNMDMISDDNLYDSVTDIMESQVDSVNSMFKVAEHWKERVKGYAPDVEEEEDKKKGK